MQRRSPLPLVSIVEATAYEAVRLRKKRLGLFGTRYTMQGRFYQDVFALRGMAIVVPGEAQQAYIHDKYMNELVQGVLRPETRERLREHFAPRIRETEELLGRKLPWGRN